MPDYTVGRTQASSVSVSAMRNQNDPLFTGRVNGIIEPVLTAVSDGYLLASQSLALLIIVIHLICAPVQVSPSSQLTEVFLPGRRSGGSGQRKSLSIDSLP